MTDKNIPRPLSESYWVRPGRFLAGEYPGKYEEPRTRQRLDALIAAGFNIFIDLTGPDEMVPYLGILREQARLYEVTVAHHRFAIGDFGLPTFRQMNAILDMIDQSLEAGRQLYLHCWGGIGRTGTTVGCYLVRHGQTGAQALDQLADWWKNVPKHLFYPRSPETQAQIDFILHWAEHDQGQAEKSRRS